MKKNLNNQELSDLNFRYLRDEIFNQKLTNELFSFEVKIDLDGKLVETIRSLNNIEAFEIYLESIDEYYDDESIIVQEADTFIETDRVYLLRSNEVNMVEERILIDEKVPTYQAKNFYTP